MVHNVWLSPRGTWQVCDVLPTDLFQWVFTSQRESAIWLPNICNVLTRVIWIWWGSVRSFWCLVLSGRSFGQPIIAPGWPWHWGFNCAVRCTVWISLWSKLHRISKSYFTWQWSTVYLLELCQSLRHIPTPSLPVSSFPRRRGNTDEFRVICALIWLAAGHLRSFISKNSYLAVFEV